MSVKSLFTLPEVLKQGKVVADPVAWKSGQITVSYLAGFLGLIISIIKVFGIEVPVTDDQLTAIAGGALAVFGIFNPVVTVASTDKIGIK